MRTIKTKILAFLLALTLILSGCSQVDQPATSSNNSITTSPAGELELANVPDYSGSPYVEINNNVPQFEANELTTNAYESYSDLDNLGRCGFAQACIGQELMPTEDRESISEVKPTGWVQNQYDSVDGKSLYNRCHLIGFQLTGENANEKNLITGTRYMNVDGMLPFENMVADYIQETGNHVLYRVTPIFEGNDLVAKGVQMEAESVEDDGDGILFNVFCYNVQPGIYIDYATGGNHLDNASPDETSGTEVTDGVIRGNSRSMIYHCPGQASYDDMADSKYLVEFNTEEDALAAGYRKAKN